MKHVLLEKKKVGSLSGLWIVNNYIFLKVFFFCYTFSEREAVIGFPYKAQIEW